MSTDQILLGVALTIVLAVGSQVFASRLHIPALIVLLPVGLAAGALTDLVNPQQLLGAAYQPLVSVAVAVILYDAGLSLDLRLLRGHPRRVVVRLIVIGVTLTWSVGTMLAMWLLGMSAGAALMIGAIIVVSGPTVVAPLLQHVRPTHRVQHILSWEGSLIDPIGGILGAIVFHAITASGQPTITSGLRHFAASIGIGVIGGLLAVTVLWLALRKLHLGEVLGTLTQLAVVIAIAAGCDVLRDDSGLIAAVITGLVLANSPAFDIASRRPFFETLVQLTLGLLFISISATVTPQSLTDIVLPTLAMTAVLVVVVRPLAALASTARTDLPPGQRRFIGWMAPRGIVAAATAATFTPELVADGFAGADKILPATFLVIVATVTLYGLTAAPVARLLGVVRSARARPLVVGGDNWVIDLARTLHARGLEVVMWAGPADQRQAIAAAGLTLAPGEFLYVATDPATHVEGLTAVMLFTSEDDFNTLAATVLQGDPNRPVYRIAPPSHTQSAADEEAGDEVLFGPGLTRDKVAAQYDDGARITARADTTTSAPSLLFRIRADGSLHPVTHTTTPSAEPGDTLIVLGR